jgi:hypothetical protein
MGAFTMDGTGMLGTGLFAGGLDVSTWGAGEFAVAAFGVFALYSMLFTSRHAAESVRSRVGKVKKRAHKIKRGFTS